MRRSLQVSAPEVILDYKVNVDAVKTKLQAASITISDVATAVKEAVTLNTPAKKTMFLMKNAVS
jgi:hypothetical protein